MFTLKTGAPQNLAGTFDLEKFKDDAVLDKCGPRDADFALLGVPMQYREKLLKLWRTDGLKLIDGREPALVLECHESREGTVLVGLEWKDDHADVGVVVLEPEDPEQENQTSDDEDYKFRLFASEAPKKWTPEEIKYLDRLWIPFNPVTPLRVNSHIRPNQPCPCGSGKKAKKCCGTQ